MLARKVAYNIIVSSAAKILSTVLALVSIGLITRYLGKEGFGDYATVLAFLSLFSAVADLGLYHISTREISRPGADEEKILGNIFSLRLISSMVVVALSWITVLFLPYPEHVRGGIITIAFSFFFASNYQILNGIFQKRLSMDKVAMGELLGKAGQLLVILGVVKLQLGFRWTVISILVNMIISFIIVFVWSRKYIALKLRFDFAYWKTFLKEALPMGAASVITFLYFKLDTILLSVMKSNAEVGIYNVAYKVLENVNFFPAMIMGLVMPLMSHAVISERKKFETISNNTFKLFVVLVIPMVVSILFFAREIIWVIGGSDFAESVKILRILVLALALIFFGHFLSTALIVNNMQKKLMYVFAFAAVCNITLNLIFIPKFSYLAAAYISVITELLVVVISFYVIVTKLKYYPRMDKISGVLLAGLGMTLVFLTFHGQLFVIAGMAGAIVYGILLWKFNVITSSEIYSLITKKGIKEYEELP